LVLVDQDTSGGAELLAMALRSYRGAKLVGTETLGYRDIRTVYQSPLPDTRLHVLVDRWVGTEPDTFGPIQSDIEMTWGSDEEVNLAQVLVLFLEEAD
jgi:C-terminal processing protease CtpA/Prc